MREIEILVARNLSRKREVLIASGANHGTGQTVTTSISTNRYRPFTGRHLGHFAARGIPGLPRRHDLQS